MSRQRVEEAIKKFPSEFGLKAFDGTFRIKLDASYVTDGGRVMLYMQRLVKTTAGYDWLDFGKTSEDELPSVIALVRCPECHGDRIIDTNAGTERCPTCKGSGHVGG